MNEEVWVRIKNDVKHIIIQQALLDAILTINMSIENTMKEHININHNTSIYSTIQNSRMTAIYKN
jgi:hypothetical protein